jgi:uncharacterized RDD family membrane protein YckC
MKKPTFRRILAFIVDSIIVTIIVSALSGIKFINPAIDKYNEAYDTYMEYIQNGLTAEDAQNILNSEEYQNMTYDITYYGRYSSIISLVISCLYYVVFQYITKGYTGGKKLMKIKVEAESGELKIYHILIRSVLINGILTSILSILTIFLLNKDMFIKSQTFIELLGMGIVFLSFGMILYREDGRGLHDLIAHTKVVSEK